MRGKRRVAEKPKQTGEGDSHHGRGRHHGLAMAATTVQPWWPLAGLPSFAPRTTRFAFCFDPRVACLGLFALGFLGLFASSLA